MKTFVLCSLVPSRKNSLFYVSFKFNITEPKGSRHHADSYFRNSSDQVQLKSNKINNEQKKYKTT